MEVFWQQVRPTHSVRRTTVRAAITTARVGLVQAADQERTVVAAPPLSRIRMPVSGRLHSHRPAGVPGGSRGHGPPPWKST